MAKKTKNKEKNTKSNSSKPNQLFQEYWPVALILVLSFFIFQPSIQYDFVLDDDLVLAKNTFVTNGKIGDIMTSSFHEGFTGKPDKNYRPLSMVAFALETQFFGKDNNGTINPHVYHFFNVLWFAISCGLLFLLLKRCFPKAHMWLPLGITLLFAWHPIHTEVVANVKGRDEIFVFLGLVSTLYTLLRYDESGNKQWLIASLFTYFLACLSKENGLPIIGLVPFTLYFFGKHNHQSTEPIITTTAFYLIPIGIYFAMQMAFTGDNGDIPGPIDNILYTEGISSSERWATPIGMIGEYIQLLILPLQLSFDYSAYQIELMDWGTPKVLISLLATIGLTGLAIYLCKKKHPIGWAILEMIIMFALVSNILFIIGTTMAERLMFSPSLGYCFIVGYLLYQFLYKNDKIQVIYYFALGAILVFYYVQVTQHLPNWENNLKLHQSGIVSAPNSARTNSFYGHRLYEELMTTQDQAQKQKLALEAITYFDRATEIVPSFRDAHHNKALCYEAIGQYDEAIKHFDKAIAIDPDYQLSICGKGLAYHKKGDNMTALQLIQQAHDIAPNNEIIKKNLISILFAIRDVYKNQGDIETAIYYDKQVKVLRGEPIN